MHRPNRLNGKHRRQSEYAKQQRKQQALAMPRPQRQRQQQQCQRERRNHPRALDFSAVGGTQWQPDRRIGRGIRLDALVFSGQPSGLRTFPLRRHEACCTSPCSGLCLLRNRVRLTPAEPETVGYHQKGREPIPNASRAGTAHLFRKPLIKWRGKTQTVAAASPNSKNRKRGFIEYPNPKQTGRPRSPARRPPAAPSAAQAGIPASIAIAESPPDPSPDEW